MQIGQKVELLHKVKGNAEGTKGIVHRLYESDLKPMAIQLYPLENNVILEVAESDLKAITETQTNGVPKEKKQGRKTRKNNT